MRKYDDILNVHNPYTLTFSNGFYCNVVSISYKLVDYEL
jgi:hypothetical protein